MPRTLTQSAAAARTAGFTLVEMVIVVGVMAVLSGISTPPIVQFMQQRDVRNEQIAQTEIRRAISAYIEERGTVPDDTETDTTDPDFWANQLAGYTNMSPGEIRLDQWERPRSYSTFQAAEFVLGTSLPIYYVSLASSGLDRIATSAPGIPGGTGPSNNNFGTHVNTVWWSKLSGGQTARITAFSQLTAGGDDIVTKLTDYPEKIEAYKTTLDRLRRIGEALDSYSKSAYAERAVACLSTTCNPTAEQQVFYPRSGYGPEAVVGSTGPQQDELYTNTRGNIDLNTYNGNGVINNGGADATRRAHMINLMRILGLPDDYCCSALEIIPGSIDPVTGKPQAMPFYYFSNPRQRTNSTTCSGTRPTAGQRKLPARLVTHYVNTGSANPTCG